MTKLPYNLKKTISYLRYSTGCAESTDSLETYEQQEQKHAFIVGALNKFSKFIFFFMHATAALFPILYLLIKFPPPDHWISIFVIQSVTIYPFRATRISHSNFIFFFPYFSIRYLPPNNPDTLKPPQSTIQSAKFSWFLHELVYFNGILCILFSKYGGIGHSIHRIVFLRNRYGG